MRRVMALALALSATAALADGGSDAGTEGVLTRVPELKRFVEAAYPPDAESEGRQGEVLLEIEISVEGKVTEAIVVESAGQNFDAAALEAVRQFEFVPAEVDGVPAPVRLTYRYGFVLRPTAPPVADAASEGAPELVILRGRAIERGTRDPLEGASIFAGGGETRSGPDGRFEMKLVPGRHTIVALLAGHERFQTEEELVPGQVTEVVYHLRRRGGSPYETVVKGDRERKEVARTTLKLEEIRRVPGTFGDAVRVVQNLPGVARTPFGLGPLVVRGGYPGDTRSYVDGHFVPVLFHFGGLNSTVNGDLLTGIDFQPGNQGARFGRSTGGVVDVTTRAGRTTGLHGYADIDLQKATVLVEGPAFGGSFAATVRRSYLDTVLETGISIGQSLGWIDEVGLDFRVAPRYYDYLARMDLPVGASDKVSFGVYGSDDVLSFVLSDPQELTPEARGSFHTHIAFHRAFGSWKTSLGPEVANTVSAVVAIDVNSGGLGPDIRGQVDGQYLSLRDDFVWRASPKLELSAGLDLLAGRFLYALTAPRPPPPGEIFDPIVSDDLITSSDGGIFVQPGLWVEAAWSPVPRLRLVPGLRFDYERYMDDRWLDPRLSMFYEAGESTVVKAAVGRFGQPPQPPLLTKRFGNPDLLPEASYQYALGVEQRLPWGLSLDAQLYYKALFDLAVGSGFIAIQGGALSTLTVQSVGLGESYGLEVLLRRELADGFFGWVSYSLSRSNRNSGPGTEWRRFALDQTHNVTVVASWRLPGDWELGGKVRYTSGAWNTPLTRAVFDADAGAYLPVPGEISSEQLPAFFQIDVRVDKRWVFENWMLDVFADVQNVTNRANVEGSQYNHDFSRRVNFTGLPVFPSLGVRGEF